MEVLRTPDECFDGLPDYDFAPHYAQVDAGDGSSLRVHFLDEGPLDAAPVLLMHGEPSWSFLYRSMIPPLVAAGHRVIVPDLVGFGRSDKPVAQSDYTYARHVGWMGQLLFDHLDLHSITLFGQDWGGLIGLRLVGAQPHRFARLVLGNTGFPTGEGKLTEAFQAWQRFSSESPSFPIGAIVNGGCVTSLSPEVIAGYDAPFPDDRYTAGARMFPTLVPTTTDDPARADNLAAWDVLRSFERPVLLTFSDSDPITGGGDRIFLRDVPGTAGQPHVTIESAGHFLQEDKGPEIAGIVNAFIAATAAS